MAIFGVLPMTWCRPCRALPLAIVLTFVALPLLSGAAAHPIPHEAHTTEDSHARLAMHTDTYRRDTFPLWAGAWHRVCFTLTNIHDGETISLPYSDPWRIENETGDRVAGEFGWQAIFHYAPGESESACWDMTVPVYNDEGQIARFEEAPPGTYTLAWPYIIGWDTDDHEVRELSLDFELVDEPGHPWPLGP